MAETGAISAYKEIMLSFQKCCIWMDSVHLCHVFWARLLKGGDETVRTNTRESRVN
jgi:hypothetical protein